MFSRKQEWTECLGKEDRDILKKLVEKTSKHRCAYLSADDVKVAQLWLALLEMKKELDEKIALLDKVIEPFKKIVELGEIEKKKAIKKLVSSIVNPKTDEEKKTVDDLVETLLKF